MYGLFPALMQTEQFRASQEQAAADRAMREREFAMRQRQMDMQEATHRQQMAESGLRLKQSQGILDAQNAVTGLAAKDAEQRNTVEKQGIMAYTPETWTPTGERDYNRAYMGLAMAKGDIQGAQGLQKQNKMLDVADEAKRLADDPEFQTKALDFISTKDTFPLKVQPGTRDPKTGQLKTPDTLVFDSGYKHELKDGDRQRIALGAALTKFGMLEEGLKQFEGVSKELRDAVDRANQRTVSVSNYNSQAEDRVTRAEDRDADRVVRQEQIAAARASRAAAGAAHSATKWQQDRLERGDRLGQEAAGYAQGLSAAKALGPQGKAAADIYGTQLAGTNQRMAGLGLRPYGMKDPVPPQIIMEETRKFMETPQGAAMAPAAAYQMIESMLNGRGADPVAQATEATRAELARLRGGRAPAGAAAQAPESPEMAHARRVQAMTPEQFAVFQKMQQGQPTSPRERALLQQAGSNF